MVIRLTTFMKNRILYASQALTYLGVIKGAIYLIANKLKIRILLSAKIRNFRIYIRTCSPDLSIAIENLVNGEFQELPVRLISEQKGLIIDGGSYIGTSAIALNELFPGKKIICVEPHKGNFEVLQKNTKNYKNIEVINAALAPMGIMSAKLHDRTREFGFTIVTPNKNFVSSREIGDINCISIEDIMLTHSVIELALLKLDIEGGELQILKNSKDWISAVFCIYIELHDRIIPGCTNTFLNATRKMQIWPTESEKLCRIRNH